MTSAVKCGMFKNLSCFNSDSAPGTTGLPLPLGERVGVRGQVISMVNIPSPGALRAPTSPHGRGEAGTPRVCITPTADRCRARRKARAWRLRRTTGPRPSSIATERTRCACRLGRRHRFAFGRGLGRAQHHLARHDDAAIGRAQVLHGAVLDRAHAFLDRGVLHGDAVDAGGRCGRDAARRGPSGSCWTCWRAE